MKWLNLSEFGLHLGFRKATSFRDKVAVLTVNDLNTLSRFIHLNDFSEKLQAVGFNRVNSDDGNAKFVKADNSINPKQLASILPITNKHLQDMPENDARAKFHVDKQAWIDLTAKLAQQGSVWKLDENYYNEAGIHWKNKISENYLDLSTKQDDRYINLAFESPLPVNM
ncbi:DNA primase, partial [Acinetobacter baumannii]